MDFTDKKYGILIIFCHKLVFYIKNRKLILLDFKLKFEYI
jgi:hypothetical protein